ncbi:MULTISPECIES: HEAT repeat domain-containing protein [Halococcus]|uniref:Adaptin protein n=1 Tax=Halococcus salifodinae DSM 8989 TaxID=1227456 RepID=M0N650_9EURY|nr:MULTISPECIES: HEAT repeat domain-containing protein [Halococcus]EMA52589.1 Adaptin protein [Halococcus salifodinae DSM 8989]
MTHATADDVRELDPDEITPADIDIERVRAGLTDEENLVRTHAAKIAGALADQDPDVVVPVVPTLLDRLAEDHSVVLKESLTALALVADERPAELTDGVPALVDLLDHDLPLVRTFAARVVRPLAAEHPEWFATELDDLLATLDSEITNLVEGLEEPPMGGLSTFEQYRAIGEEGRKRQLAARAVAANVVVAVAEADSGALVEHVPAVVDLLDSDDTLLVTTSADVIASVAEDYPEAVSDATDPLCACLDTHDGAVRANAVTALGYIGDDSAVGPLREVANDAEADEDLRALAAETADWLARDAA